jgi:hypothetical protein
MNQQFDTENIATELRNLYKSGDPHPAFIRELEGKLMEQSREQTNQRVSFWPISFSGWSTVTAVIILIVIPLILLLANLDLIQNTTPITQSHPALIPHTTPITQSSPALIPHIGFRDLANTYLLQKPVRHSVPLIETEGQFEVVVLEVIANPGETIVLIEYTSFPYPLDTLEPISGFPVPQLRVGDDQFLDAEISRFMPAFPYELSYVAEAADEMVTLVFPELPTTTEQITLYLPGERWVAERENWEISLPLVPATEELINERFGSYTPLENVAKTKQGITVRANNVHLDTNGQMAVQVQVETDPSVHYLPGNHGLTIVSARLHTPDTGSILAYKSERPDGYSQYYYGDAQPNLNELTLWFPDVKPSQQFTLAVTSLYLAIPENYFTVDFRQPAQADNYWPVAATFPIANGSIELHGIQLQKEEEMGRNASMHGWNIILDYTANFPEGTELHEPYTLYAYEDGVKQASGELTSLYGEVLTDSPLLLPDQEITFGFDFTTLVIHGPWYLSWESDESLSSTK